MSKAAKIGLFFSFALVALFSLSLIVGAEGVAYKDLAKLWQGNTTTWIIVEELRFPRTLVAAVAGSALGLSGVLMQAVLKNPLASPFTLGISQASAFGAAFGIIILQSRLEIHLPYLIVLSAFISSLLCTFMILLLGKKSNLRPESLILTGVALGALFSAMTMFLQYFASEIDVAASVFWTFGDLSKATLSTSFLLLLFLVPILLWYFFYFWKLDALLLGSDEAKNLGIDVKRFRVIAMVLASLLSSITVAFLGIIGFIGLIAPHIIRLLVGGSHKALLPLSALSGALLLVGADILSRSFMPPIILPIGILTSFVGAPLFLYLLSRRR